MLYDGSALDPMNGITFRGHSIPEFCERSQKVHGGEEPLPEAMFYLLLTGEYPSDMQLKELQNEWRHRGDLDEATINFILHLSPQAHPMTMLSMTLLLLQQHSKFDKAYHRGVGKAHYW